MLRSYRNPQLPEYKELACDDTEFWWGLLVQAVGTSCAGWLPRSRLQDSSRATADPSQPRLRISPGDSDAAKTAQTARSFATSTQDFACRLPLGCASLTPAGQLKLSKNKRS